MTTIVAPPIHGLDIHPVYQKSYTPEFLPAYQVMSIKATEGVGAAMWEPQSKRMFQSFRALKIPFRGLYWWLRSDMPIGAQLDNLKRYIDGIGGLLDGEFVQCDWERTYRKDGSLVPDPSLAQIRIATDMQEARWPGRCIMYASDWISHWAEWRSLFPYYPLWYANYNIDRDRRDGGWQETERYRADLWQFTDQYHSFGITERCDGNTILNLATLQRITNTLPPKPPTPTPPKEVNDVSILLSNSGQLVVESGNTKWGPVTPGTYPPQYVWWRLMEDGTKRWIRPNGELEDMLAAPSTTTRMKTEQELLGYGDYQAPGMIPAPTVPSPVYATAGGDLTLYPRPV